MKIISFSLRDTQLRQLYDDLFDNCPDAFIQQSTYWAEVIAELGPDIPIFLLACDRDEPIAGLPLYLYKNELGDVLTSVPQAGPLGGIFHRPELTNSMIETCYAFLLKEALTLASYYKCLALSFITNPFCDDLAYYQSQLSPDYLLANFTQSINLNNHFSPDGIVQLPAYSRRSNLSRNLVKCHSSGFRSRISTDAGELNNLYNIHIKRHAELAAAPLDRRLLSNIAMHLIPRDKAFFQIVESDEGVASWGIYIHHKNVLDVLRLNMDSAFAACSPNFLNTEVSLSHARNLGITVYNWQSSPSRTSGVFRYKQQWGAHESNYWYITRLLCPPEYLKNIGLETLKREYHLHFIAPYAAAEDDFRPGHYRKE